MIELSVAGPLMGATVRNCHWLTLLWAPGDRQDERVNKPIPHKELTLC